MSEIWKDLRYTARTFRKSPLFVLFVLLTLGLGIGANTSVFTIIDTLLLNSLPVEKPSELTAVAAADSKKTSASSMPLPISYLNLQDYQRENRVFRGLAGYTSPRILTLREGGGAERMFGELVTGNYFSVLGLRPSLGRFFSLEEDSAPGAHAVAVMNYATWRSRFGGAADVVGGTLRLNGVDFTVIGVAPPGFIGVNAVFGPDLWMPATMAEQLLPNEMGNALIDRVKALFLAVGRLRQGISRTQAQANIATIAAALAREHPEVNVGHTLTVRPISDVIFSSANAGSASIVFAGVVLTAVAGIVLLIACSNVANLLLARSATRQHEIAVRLAIGASRGRMVRELLTESVFLGLLSGLLGLLLGFAGLRYLWSFLPAETAKNMIAPKLDAPVYIFTLAVSLLTGFIFGVLPAFRASRIGVTEVLKHDGHTVGRGRGGIRVAKVLLVGQVAFSFLLLVTAGLFLRSIGRAYDIDPGFQADRLLVLMTNPGQAGYRKPQAKGFYKEVREQLAAMPGVASVSWASNLPLWGRVVDGLQVEGREQRSKADSITTILNIVDLGYFETAGVAIHKGREFMAMDGEDSTPVAIVNEKLARDFWPNQDPLGKRIQLPAEKTMRQIVGIAANANYSTLAEPPQLCVYVPLAEDFSDAMTLYVRSKENPERILRSVQQKVQAIGPQILLNDIRTGSTIVGQALLQARMGVMLLSVFGLLALGLASIGLYGIMAYSVSQRKREIGMRMALGATRGRVMRLVLERGLLVVAPGVLIGFGAALIMGQLLSRMLYGVSTTDPISMVGAALVLLAVALVACYLPARQASRLDPLAALRES